MSGKFKLADEESTSLLRNWLMNLRRRDRNGISVVVPATAAAAAAVVDFSIGTDIAKLLACLFLL